MKRRYILIFLSFLILISIIIYSGPKKVYEIFSKSEKTFLLYAFLLSTLTVFLRVLKWKVILNKASFTDVLPVQLLGTTISNFTPGKIGEPTKSLLIKMKAGIPVSKSLTSIIWERILDVFVLILFSLIFLGTFSSSLFLIEIISILIFTIIILVFLIIIYKKNIGIKFFLLLKKLPFFNKISNEFINTFYRERVSKKSLILSIFITLAAWILDSAVFYLSFRSIGIDINPIFFIGLFSVSTLIGILSFLPGGLGSTDAVMIFILSANITPAEAVTGVFVARLLTFWYFALLGFLSFIYLSKYFDLKKIFS